MSDICDLVKYNNNKLREIVDRSSETQIHVTEDSSLNIIIFFIKVAQNLYTEFANLVTHTYISLSMLVLYQQV